MDTRKQKKCWKLALLNEKYIKYYGKSIVPLVSEYHIRRPSSLVNFLIDKDPRQCLHDVSESYFHCLNDQSSLTNAIRRLERNQYYESESKICIKPTDKAVEMWKHACQQQIDSELVGFSYADVGAALPDGRDDNVKIVDYVNCRDCDRTKDVIPAFSLMFPAFKDDVGSSKLKEFVDDIIDLFNENGYNYCGIHAIDAAKQPINGKNIMIVQLAFEALYSDIVSELSDALYHVTSYDTLKSIMKHGIVPHSVKNGNFQHPDRVYLFSNAPVVDIIEFMKRRFSLDQKMCIVKIDKDKLVNSAEYKSGKMLFYVDPKFGSSSSNAAIFTTSTLPSSFLDDEVACFHFDNAGHPVKDGVISLKGI